MSLVKNLSHFWNVTLGVDCPDEVEIVSDGSILIEELKESQKRVEGIEQKFTSTSNKAGKGGKSNKLDVPTVTIDTKAVEKAQKSKAQKSSKKQDVEIEK